MIAQIRSGLWVRNGFAVRGQLLHYRDFMLRELCFDQDLFLIQASFVILDANLIIVSLMDRFQLVDWFSGKHAHPLYDTPQTFSMVEEFLYVLITCMSETGNARKLTLQDNIRRELIHALASGPCVFTDILKRLAERMVDDVRFEGILNEVANFKSPESTSDSGLYELKDELYDEVDPFFHHFNRNKREEVSSILRDRIKKKTGISDPVLIPRALGIQGGPFTAVSSALLSESLLRIVYHSIANVIRQTDFAGAIPASADAILDQALYLVMLGVVEHNREFADLGCQHVCHESLTLLDILSAFEDHSKFKAYTARVGWVLDRFADHHREAVQAVRRSKEGNAADAAAVEDARKNAAKARQKAILKDFAAAQQSFLENLEDGDADDEQNEHTSVPSMGTCIFCQEELEDSRPFGSLALIQPSRFIKAFPDNRWDALSYVLGADPETIDVHVPCDCGDGALNNPFSSSSDATTFGMHTSLCGHMMHLDCFTVYLSSIRQRHRGQAQRNHPESISRKEFICPLCKSLGNCVLPAIRPPQNPTVNPQTFIEWIRGNGIALLRSPPDRLLEFLQVKSGYGSFTFWGAQDSHYPSFVKSAVDDQHKMIDTVIGAARAISLQSRHLRDRIEPDTGDRGAGAYLPEDLVGYTIKCIEISQRGANVGQASLINVSEQSLRTIRGLLAVMAKMAILQFQTRPDQGQDAIRQAIIKRLLPEWKREPAYQLPLLLREPVTLLVEVAAIAPDMLPQAIIVLYYANLARVTIAILTSLSKSFTSWNHDVDVLPAVGSVGLLGDVKGFVSMIARHSPLLDLASQMALRNLGPDRLERLIYSFSLPFLRCSALLQEAALPGISNFQKSKSNSYVSLLQAMGIPNPSNILLYETLQNLLSGWCTHYGFFHSHSPQHHMILPEHPGVYKLTPLPDILDTIFSAESPVLRCRRCNTSPVEAGICLICGITVCIQSHCCREMDYRERGECNMHTRE
jgi:E3 ubiquitin-protein ligase UBR1